MPSFLFCPRQQLQQLPQGVRRPHHGVRHKHCDGRGTTRPPLPPPSHFLTSKNLRPTSFRAVEGSGGGGDIGERAAAARAAFLCCRCSGFSLCAQAGRCCWWRWQLAVFLILAGGGVGCAWCDNTLSPPRPVGGRASQTVSPGSPVGEYSPWKETSKSTHARRRPGEGAPSENHELCDRKFTCPRRRPRGDTHASPSYPIRSPQTLGKPSSDTLKGPSENPPQTPSKDPRKTLLRHPQRTHGKPSPQGPLGS